MLVYLALGSNLGDREAYLRAALSGLSKRGIAIADRASLYWTEPRDVPDQPWFLNTVVSGNTDLSPAELLAACLAVEAENGRRRAGSEGPRTLDIDIIFYGDSTVREPGLEIPHPRFNRRRFVLEPLAEIAADFVDPVSRKTVAELLTGCPDRAPVVALGRK